MMKLYINWFDLVIILMLVASVWRGMKAGFVTQFLVNACFFGGLFLGGWLFPYLLPIHDRTLLTIVNGNLVLVFAVYLAIKGFDLGRYIHFSFGKSRPHQLETGLSVLSSLVFGLAAVWLIASMIGRLPFEGFSNSANDSLIVQFLDRHLPPIPAVFAEFNKQLNPNSPPQIFNRTNFQTERYQPIASSAIKSAAAEDERSIVRITSFGCGGIVTGSGFVVAPDLVLTNAHVIAGVHRPIVKYGTQSYAGTPVLYDSSLDLAALRLSGLAAKPLTIFNGEVDAGTTVAVIGYPGGNYTVSPGVVLDNLELFTSTIYGVGTVGRQTYEFKATIAPGSSGGPMVLLDGRVAGIVYAKPASANGYGYALTSKSLLAKLRQAKQSTRRVGTGACLSN